MKKGRAVLLISSFLQTLWVNFIAFEVALTGLGNQISMQYRRSWRGKFTRAKLYSMLCQIARGKTEGGDTPRCNQAEQGLVSLQISAVYLAWQNFPLPKKNKTGPWENLQTSPPPSAPTRLQRELAPYVRKTCSLLLAQRSLGSWIVASTVCTKEVAW